VVPIRTDWLFKGEDSICSFRCAGVLIRDNKVLVQRDKNGPEYALPGGHVKIGEASRESLIREFKEEADADIVCERLIWTEECFWEWNNKLTHSIVFYYLIDLRNAAALPDGGAFIPQKDNENVLLGWLTLGALKDVTIYPAFLKEKVFDLGTQAEHFITRG